MITIQVGGRSAMPRRGLKIRRMSLDAAREVLRIEAEAVRRQVDNLGPEFLRALEAIEGTSGRLCVTGLGKSGLIGQKVAATLASTGTPAYFLHAGEASHGDLGMLMPGDVVLAMSASGAHLGF